MPLLNVLFFSSNLLLEGLEPLPLPKSILRSLLDLMHLYIIILSTCPGFGLNNINSGSHVAFVGV